MAFYKFLFENKYLETKYENSSISLKGAQKLSSIFEDTYEFIKIEIINESEFFQEFETFNEISQKFIKGNKKPLIISTDDNYYSSDEEDKLYEELKKFNLNYGKFKEINPKLEQDFPNQDSLFFDLLQFHEKREKIITNLTCKKILRAQKQKDFLYFYIWFNEENHHYSLVAYYDDYYIFLDSCSIFFKRWPNQEIISKNDDNKKILFNKEKTFVMFSFLQYDDYNCVSFSFSFIEILIQLYQNYKSNNWIIYLSRYFKFLYNDMFMTETDNCDINSIEPQIYYLPEEILELSQSNQRLKDLLKNAEKFRKDEVETIKKIIAENKKGKKILSYRSFHLNYLMESI